MVLALVALIVCFEPFWSGGPCGRQGHTHAVLSTELVLENYHQMFTDLNRRVHQLMATIRAKQEIVNTQVGAQLVASNFVQCLSCLL